MCVWDTWVVKVCVHGGTCRDEGACGVNTGVKGSLHAGMEMCVCTHTGDTHTHTHTRTCARACVCVQWGCGGVHVP